MIDRRSFITAIAGAAAMTPMALKAQQSATFEGSGLARTIAALDRRSGGRLGVALLDKGSGARFAWRGDELFPLCSTFKFPLAAATLHRVDRGEEHLNRRVPVEREDLVPYSPAVENWVGTGATVAQLCEAVLTLSDNAAANLLLRPLGGPSGLTRFFRATGDSVTRLDRIEPALNDVPPGSRLDTTSPNVMTDDLDRYLLGDVLSPASRRLLLAWMMGNRTGDRRIRAGTPAGWVVADKTGTCGPGSANDVALLQPPARAPLLLSIYIDGSTLAPTEADAIHAQVARAVAASL